MRNRAAQTSQRSAQTVLEAESLAAPAAPAVEVFTSESAFAGLALEWNGLHAQALAASVFNSWVWQYQWWQVYGRGQPLRVLAARQDGEAIGMLAVYLQTVDILGVRVCIARFVGTGGDTHPDDLGPVLAAGKEDRAALMLARAVLQWSAVDVLLFTDIDPASAFPRAMERARREQGRAGLQGVSERIAYVDLPDGWPGFLASLDAQRRSQLRRARKKLAAAHSVEFFVWSDAATLDGAVERLAELHRRRWQRAGGSESFATPEYVEFHRRIIAACYPRGWLRLYCLEVDGEIAAITYCYRFRNRVYLMQGGFDPDLANCNPGKVLLGHALEHAIAEGNDVFDFLRGEHRYKDELASGHRETVCMRVFRRSLGALAYRLRRIWLPTWKARFTGAPLKLKP